MEAMIKRKSPWSCHRGQTVIELVIALIGVMTLFIGTLRIWAWLVGSLVWRQEAYEATRDDAADATKQPGKADYYNGTAPNFLGKK